MTIHILPATHRLVTLDARRALCHVSPPVRPFHDKPYPTTHASYANNTFPTQRRNPFSHIFTLTYPQNFL